MNYITQNEETGKLLGGGIIEVEYLGINRSLLERGRKRESRQKILYVHMFVGSTKNNCVTLGNYFTHFLAYKTGMGSIDSIYLIGLSPRLR